MPLSFPYDLALKSLQGFPIDLAAFKGRKILIVNTASECGYTPQYKALQELYENYKSEIEIIGCPCNQFGAQEPGSAEEIALFCTNNFSITFPLTEKIEVKGPHQHPLYQWLCQKKENGVEDSEVSWNFQKYLLDEQGYLMAVIPPGIAPNSEEFLALAKLV